MVTTLQRIKATGNTAAEQARKQGEGKEATLVLGEVAQALFKNLPQSAFGGFKIARYGANIHMDTFFTEADSRRDGHPILYFHADKRDADFSETKWTGAVQNIRATWSKLLEDLGATINVTVKGEETGRRTIEIHFPSLQNATSEQAAELIDKLQIVVEKIKDIQALSTDTRQSSEQARATLEGKEIPASLDGDGGLVVDTADLDHGQKSVVGRVLSGVRRQHVEKLGAIKAKYGVDGAER